MPTESSNYSVFEIAKLIGKSTARIYQIIDEMKLEKIKEDGKLRFKPEDVERIRMRKNGAVGRPKKTVNFTNSDQRQLVQALCWAVDYGMSSLLKPIVARTLKSIMSESIDIDNASDDTINGIALSILTVSRLTPTDR